MFFEMRFDLGTLDSGERSLPFGLLVRFTGSRSAKIRTSSGNHIHFTGNNGCQGLFETQINFVQKFGDFKDNNKF